MREQILRPLQDIETIKERQSFINEFKNNHILLDEVRNELKYVADIDAILTRLSLQRA
jgi:DNA mismatch repair ATPase MutS